MKKVLPHSPRRKGRERQQERGPENLSLTTKKKGKEMRVFCHRVDRRSFNRTGERGEAEYWVRLAEGQGMRKI